MSDFHSSPVVRLLDRSNSIYDNQSGTSLHNHKLENDAQYLEQLYKVVWDNNDKIVCKILMNLQEWKRVERQETQSTQ